MKKNIDLSKIDPAMGLVSFSDPHNKPFSVLDLNLKENTGVDFFNTKMIFEYPKED